MVCVQNASLALFAACAPAAEIKAGKPFDYSALALVDEDKATRRVIDHAVNDYAAASIPFLKAFPNSYGLGEKQNRLKHGPTDQPVL